MPFNETSECVIRTPCILWLVISIRCSVIVLIGLLFREFFVSFLTNTVQACTINSDK